MTIDTAPAAVNTVDFADLESLIGKDLGATSWRTIAQDRIDLFAEATDDPQWIHTDPVRAKDGPFGTTIAHGFLTVSLLIPMLEELLSVQGVTTKINIGMNTVRLTAPVKVDSRIRLVGRIVSVTPTKGDGKEFVWDCTVEIEGAQRPALVAEAVWRFLP
jgi:acyl dehydratase